MKKLLTLFLVSALCVGSIVIGPNTFVKATSTEIVVNDSETGLDVNQIIFSEGWDYQRRDTAYLRDETWSKVSGDIASIRFDGNKIAIHGTTNVNHGYMALSIDGGEEFLVSNYDSIKTKQAVLYTSENLGAGEHTLSIRVTGTKEDVATDTRVSLDFVTVTPHQEPATVTRTINDNTRSTANGHFDYSASWFYETQMAGAHEMDYHWSDVKNTYYNVRFNGTSITIYGAKDSDGGQMAVSIDGQAETTVDTYANTRENQGVLYNVSGLSGGSHVLRVRVLGTRNSESTGSKIYVDKVEYNDDGTPPEDARGRIMIPQSQLELTPTTNGETASNIVDGDNSTLWMGSAVTNQSITVNLGGTYTVDKIGLLPDVTNTKKGRIKKMNVSVSTDGVNYTKVLDNVANATLGWGIRDQLGITDAFGYIYFKPSQASHIKIDILNTVDGSAPRISEMRLYRYITAPVAPTLEAKIATIPVVNDNLSRASRVLIEKGLQLHSWIPVPQSGRGTPNIDEINSLNLSGVAYYSKKAMYNNELHQQNPNLQWNLARAPFGAKAAPPVLPEHHDGYLPGAQEANIDNLVSMCFGDEQPYTSSQGKNLEDWFNLTHTLYPNVLLHTNQWHGLWNGRAYDDFIRRSQPDLLTYDHYYYDQNGSMKDYDSARGIISALNWHRGRALRGIDGTGSKPIAFGQYIGAYKIGTSQEKTGWFETTESQKNLATNATWLVGGKWVDLFRTEYDKVYGFLFGEDGWPTHHYYEYAKVFRQSRNLGTHLVRLNNQDVRLVPGQHRDANGQVVNNETISDRAWNMGTFSSNSTYHVRNIVATNVGTQNNGLRGDVAISYFRALPGLDTTEFFTSTDPKYFMVLNGLVSGNGLRPEQQHGSAEETRQIITLTLDKGHDLMKVNRDTGDVEPVNLTPIGDGLYALDISLGGGEIELFFWAEDGTPPITTPIPAQ